MFAPVYGPPFVRGLDRGRRYGTLEDFRNFVKLADLSPALHHSGGTVCEPVDVAVNKRHLDMVMSHSRYSDKPFMGSLTHLEGAADTVAMARLVLGAEFVERNCVTLSLINANSPMVFDATMLGALKVYARANQATIVTPFILSGAPTFGAPEATLALFGSAQLARRLKLPFRSRGSLCASKVADAQAAHESTQTLLPTLLADTNFVLHGAGWLESGLASGYEKFVIDADQLAMMEVLGGGYDLSENGQALDAIRELGTGGHFLGCAHTQANFATAFYCSSVADNNAFEQWGRRRDARYRPARQHAVEGDAGRLRGPGPDP